MRLIIFILVLLSSSQLHAQWNPCYDTSGYGGFGLDTNDFDAVQTAHFKIAIDTTDTTNLWAIGDIAKTGFPQPLAGVNAIQTDTANPYAAGRTSQFFVWRDTATNMWDPEYPFSLSFWHYYDVDSLTDTCLVQITTDSGATWSNVNWSVHAGMFMTNYTGSLSGTPADPNVSQMLMFSGSSGGWVHEFICFYAVAIKSTSTPIDNGFGYRFLFKSDTANTDKPGWMIDDMVMVEPVMSGGISDVGSNPLSIYPNPSVTGIYTLSYPQRFVKGTLIIYDIFGRRVKALSLQKQIDLSDMPPGMYQYRASFDSYSKVYSGKLMRK